MPENLRIIDGFYRDYKASVGPLATGLHIASLGHGSHLLCMSTFPAKESPGSSGIRRATADDRNPA